MINIKEKLKKISSDFNRSISSVFGNGNIDEELEALEEQLILSDISMSVTENIIKKVRKRVRKGDNPKDVLKEEIISILDIESENYFLSEKNFISLIVGVNGGGKTTTAAKLGYLLKNRGNKVLLAAADTFRAAGSSQLELWGEKLGIDTIGGEKGADPSSVVFNSLSAYKNRGYDDLIIDTAGRVHTKENLMKELEKTVKVIKGFYPEAPEEVLMVLDATIGQNAIVQAREFLKFSGLTGIVLTKMDGTAKGGTIITIAREFNLPVKFIGVGEKVEDIFPFSPRKYGEIIFED
jgi:fused signal recognition particle receptor